MKTLKFDEKEFEVDVHLESFDIYQKPSSNVEFFGTDVESGKFFIQFKNGSSYIFNNVEQGVLLASVEDGSIGKYFSSAICRKYESVKLEFRLVKEVLPA